MKGLPIGALLEELTKELSAVDVQEINILSTISSEITMKRLEMGMNQEEFAKYMDVTQAMISKWESGNYNFTISSIVQIFERLHMKVEIVVKDAMPSLPRKVSSKADQWNRHVQAGEGINMFLPKAV